MARTGLVLAALVLVLGGCGGGLAPGACGVDGVTWTYARPTNLRQFDVFTLRNGVKRQLTHDKRSYHPSISPDGQRIVFVRGLDQWSECCGFARTQLFVMNADGTGVEPLVDHDHDDYPRWSPMGDLIAFVRGDGQGHRQLMVVPAGGGPARVLATEVGGTADPAWSPDGTAIAWPQDGRIDRIDVATGNQKSVSVGEDAGTGDPVAWADGGFVVRLSGTFDENYERSVKDGLYRISADGTRHLLQRRGDFPTRLPGGRLAVVEIDDRNDRRRSTLVTMDVDGSGKRTVAELGIYFPYNSISVSAARCPSVTLRPR